MSNQRSVLIIGGSGFVGSHLALRLRDSHKVFTTHFRRHHRIRGVTSIPMAVNKPDWMKEVILSTQPEIIIYAAGTPAAGAEAKDLDLVYSSGAVTAVAASAILNSRFIYLSNSTVYNGDVGNYKETDIPMPVLTEGRAKFSGENGVRSRATHHAVVRSAPVFGLGPPQNPSRTDHWLRTLSLGEPLELDDAELHSPMHINGLTDAIDKVCTSSVENRVFHCSGLEPVTDYTLCTLIAKRLGIPTGKLRPRAGSARNYVLDGSESAFCLQIEPLLLEQSLDLLEKQLLASRA